jgi:hypothetical protein
MTLEEQIMSIIYEQTINILVDKKHLLDEAFNNGEINYAEYEEKKWLISNDLDSLSCSL